MVFNIFIRFQCLEYYIVIVRYRPVFVHCLLVFVYVYVIYVNLNKEKRKLKKKNKKEKKKFKRYSIQTEERFGDFIESHVKGLQRLFVK